MKDDVDPALGAGPGKPEPTSDSRDSDKPLTTSDIAGARSASERRPAEDRSFQAPARGDSPRPETGDEGLAPLFAGDEGQQLQEQWDKIQAGFVDEPRAAVEKADSLVAQTMNRLAQMFADERAGLETQWNRGESGVGTEDLRLALRRYRSFFSRLLAI